MLLINKSNRNYMFNDLIFEKNSTIDIEDKKAIEVLLKQDGVEKFINVDEVEKMQEELDLFKLKEEAQNLGIKFSPNIKAETLKKKIEDFKNNK